MRARPVIDALFALIVFVWLGMAADIAMPSPVYAVGWYEYCPTLAGTCPGAGNGCTGCVPTPGQLGTCNTTTWPMWCGGGKCMGSMPPGCSCNPDAC